MDIKKIKTLLRRKFKSDRAQSSSGSDSSFTTPNTSPRASTTVDSRQDASPRQPPHDEARTRSTELNGKGATASHENGYLPPHRSVEELSSDLRHISLGDDDRLMTSPGSQEYSADVADHNPGARSNQATAINNRGVLGEKQRNTRRTKGEKMKEEKDQRSFDTNEHDRHVLPAADGLGGYQPSGHHRSSIGALSSSPTSQISNRDSMSLRRKPVGSGLGSAGWQAALDGSMEEGGAVNAHAEPPSLDGVVDLTNTADTEVHERWAPAVTHETVIPHRHHIREEQIHREIHNHTYLHRIQPVLEFEVLPARHFVPDSSGQKLVEVSEDELPECTGDNQRWFIAEKRSTVTHNGRPPNGTQPLTGLDRCTHQHWRTRRNFEDQLIQCILDSAVKTALFKRMVIRKINTAKGDDSTEGFSIHIKPVQYSFSYYLCCCISNI
ncbi:uncharacterized protein BDZ99DRAFT_572298 [Mytilinidion resinicola]|uniref:Uncharacterized protein n=1 Tax=Mytilinidion resinicola TaxID=574789 RepID=A0A6A6YHX2_9PEZI|nr:uncharacterized protein BDZ99DRAFT_572298 [Mytilinidion resinicola]KAF2808432.1 hypothetical protein BDZ99DRAFT_572298 [Mytilinidion resinicola]